MACYAVMEQGGSRPLEDFLEERATENRRRRGWERETLALLVGNFKCRKGDPSPQSKSCNKYAW